MKKISEQSFLSLSTICLWASGTSLCRQPWNSLCCLVVVSPASSFSCLPPAVSPCLHAMGNGMTSEQHACLLDALQHIGLAVFFLQCAVAAMESCCYPGILLYHRPGDSVFLSCVVFPTFCILSVPLSEFDPLFWCSTSFCSSLKKIHGRWLFFFEMLQV